MPLKVNDEIIDPSLIDEEFSLIKSHYESLAQVSCCERDDEFLGYAKENIIKRILLAQEAESKGHSVLKAEVDEALEKLKEQQGGEDSFFSQNELSPEAEAMLRQDLATRIRLEKYIDSICGPNPDPTEEDVESYYHKHIDDFKTEEEIRASHIFKSLRQAENKVDLYNEFREIRRRATQGEDFDQLAREFSDKPEEEIDLGFFKQGEHLDEFETITFSMEVGEISPIFSSHWGYHLAKVTDRRPPEPQPLEELREQLKTLMVEDHRRDRIDQHTEKLKETARIEDLADAEETSPDQQA
ncbi:MAG: peptidyl-prolyl cis-trans isomerase [Verrucomicrobiota bacterium]